MKKIVLLSLIFVVVAGFALWANSLTPLKIASVVPNYELPNGSSRFKLNGQDFDIPERKILSSDYHVFQTFNNCGPASLSMALSYFGINESQASLGNQLRPYQVANGDNDDKSVTLEELAQKAEEFGFTAYHRPNGNFEIIKGFIANDMPVIARTWTKPNEDIGHYRVIKGYDATRNEIIQDDSLQGKNLVYSITDFNQMWNKFNYEYLVLVPQDKVSLARQILGSEVDADIAWKNAADSARAMLAQNPNDATTRFNLSVALFNIGDYRGSVAEFEKVENNLPFRTLWYQTEPIEAYQVLRNYDRVFEITNNILENGNRAYSELYQIRGEIYLDQGNIDAARGEFEKAIQYNKNFEPAKQSLSEL